jgi:transcriptional regulator GlxA family with amidase domain
MKMIRFTHAVNMIQTHTEVNMTEIAYATGYYDQAHFNRDFKFFAGTNPKEFRQRQYTISRVIRPKVTYQPLPCYNL